MGKPVRIFLANQYPRIVKRGSQQMFTMKKYFTNWKVKGYTSISFSCLHPTLARLTKTLFSPRTTPERKEHKQFHCNSLIPYEIYKLVRAVRSKVVKASLFQVVLFIFPFWSMTTISFHTSLRFVFTSAIRRVFESLLSSLHKFRSDSKARAAWETLK